MKYVDVKNAFIHGDMLETAYMHQFSGFEEGGSTMVCKLQKALYGLKGYKGLISKALQLFAWYRVP